MTPQEHITRVTLFRIPSKENQEKLLDAYRTLKATARKNGEPYILSAVIGSTYDDTRNQGYTLAAVTTFATVEDMNYYDNECEAHAKLKPVAKSVHEGAMMVFLRNAV